MRDIITGQMSSWFSLQDGNLILKRRNDILAVYFSRTGEQYILVENSLINAV